jgi:hypothetical protein
VAGARRLILAAAMSLAAAARGAERCAEGRAETGLVLTPAPDGLGITVVDEGSAGERSGLRVGDTVVQLNAAVARSCADYTRTLRDARKDRKALLVLVRRADAEVPLVLAAAVWQRVAVAAPAAPPEPPTVQTLVATPPPALPHGAEVSLTGVLRRLADLSATAVPPTRIETYRRAVAEAESEVAALEAAGTVPAGLVGGLHTILRYHVAAGVAWMAEESLRERDRRPRHFPAGEATVAPFFADSDVASTIEDFPFLRQTVVQDPGPGVVGGETAGLWRPVEARTLLWTHAREEQARLEGWLRVSARGP